MDLGYTTLNKQQLKGNYINADACIPLLFQRHFLVCLPAATGLDLVTARTFLSSVGLWLEHHKATLSASNQPADVHSPSQ